MLVLKCRIPDNDRIPGKRRNEKIKNCDIYKYLQVRIDKDGQGEKGIREKIVKDKKLLTG